METNTPQLSVIVPVYDVEKFLDKCLSSILSQTFTDFELILVDDGSTDGSGEICDRYAESDNRIHVIHKKWGAFFCKKSRNNYSTNKRSCVDWLWCNNIKGGDNRD